MNSRLDTLQAAILIEKLKVFPEEIKLRQAAADRYQEGLHKVAKAPAVIAGGTSVWAQYTIEVDDPDSLGAHLKGAGIPTARYYPIPMHLQAPYAQFPKPLPLPASESAARRVISLPMHADLDASLQARIVDAVREFCG